MGFITPPKPAKNPAAILSEVFAEFCESQIHLDSMLAKVVPHHKSKVATLLGAFLRRPVTIAEAFGVKLGGPGDEFWESSFIKLKKNQNIHDLFRIMWDRWEDLPREGSLIDFPKMLRESLISDWGKEKAESMAKFLTQDPLTTVRLHRRAFENGKLKPEVEEWLKTAELPKSRPGHYAPHAWVFRGFAAVQKNDLFQKGYLEIQDEGSQFMSAYSLHGKELAPFLSPEPVTTNLVKSLPAPFLPELPPLTVVDACAGAGGKTLALADLLQGKGRLFAYDIFERKVRSLRQRAERAGERNIQAVWLKEGDTSPLEKFYGTADAVLVDAPCTGYGVLRRNPDIKWNRKPAELERREREIPIEELQMNVLTRYAKLVKSGGTLTYGVCTFSKAESLDRVTQFLSENADFKLLSQGFIGPFDTDGFFMAQLLRS